MIKKIFSIILIIMISGMFTSCMKNKEKDITQINVFVDEKDNNIVNVINYIKQEYEYKNTNTKINFVNVIGDEQIIKLLTDNKVDIVFTNRNRMIELASKGLLGKLDDIKDKIKMDENYYDITTLYGSYNNQIYGIGFMPFSFEVYYNKDALQKIKLDVPENLQDIYKIMQYQNKSSIKIPALIPDNININELIFSTVANNLCSINKIEDIYDSKSKYIEKSAQIQIAFDYINKLHQKGIINRNTFEVINVEKGDSIKIKESPIIISVNNYSNFSNKNLMDYSIVDFNSVKINNTIILAPIISVYGQSVNKKSVSDFIEYIYSEDFQNKLRNKGLITLNIKANDNVSENEKNVRDHIHYADDKNIFFSYNVPKEISENINNKVYSIITGNYTGEEWKDIVKNIK